jgi:hypothetical protein
LYRTTTHSPGVSYFTCFYTQAIGNSVKNSPQYYDLKALRQRFPGTKTPWWSTVHNFVKGPTLELLKKVVSPGADTSGVSCCIMVSGWVALVACDCTHTLSTTESTYNC